MPVRDPSVYFPLREKVITYQVTAGPYARKTQPLELAKLRRPSGTLAWRFQLSPSLASFIRVTPEGDFMMPAVTDTKGGVVIVTTPANPFLLKDMKPGEMRSFSQTVSVNYLNDPGDKKYSGSVNGTYTYLGTYQVTVPAGTYEAVLLRQRCDGKIGPAHTQDRTYYLFAPGVGVVAMIAQEDVTTFWMFHVDTTTGKVLSSN